MDIYAANILDHYKNPRNQGEIPNASSRYSMKNPSCGDEMTIDILVDGDVLKDLKFSGVGCAISQSAISILSEEIIGMTLNEVLAVSKDDLLEMLGVPVSERRLKCAVLSLVTLKNAIHHYLGDGVKLKWIDVL